MWSSQSHKTGTVCEEAWQLFSPRTLPTAESSVATESRDSRLQLVNFNKRAAGARLPSFPVSYEPHLVFIALQMTFLGLSTVPKQLVFHDV